MRLILLTLAALIAFAANSVLTRIALVFGEIGPAEFLTVRLISGAVTLALLVALTGGIGGLLKHGSLKSSAALVLYAAAFSFAYLTLDAGLGALILFGGVQITMFVGAVLQGENPTLWRWVGSLLGMIGLGVLFAPGAEQPDILGAMLMVLSAIGWGIYSLRGREVSAPLQATASNFILAVPAGLILLWIYPSATSTSLLGFSLAVASGALASGVGYAIWYATLPKLDASLAAILQLTVPVIALIGGVIFLGESVSWSFAVSAILIIGGVLIAILAPKRSK